MKKTSLTAIVDSVSGLSPPPSPALTALPYQPLSPASKETLERSCCRVRTAVRIRPPNNAEIKEGCKLDTIFINKATRGIEVVAAGATMALPNKKYNFDNNFSSSATQGEVYAAIGRPLVHCVMQGVNSSLFAYGQTGTGKTHSIVGNSSLGAAGGSSSVDLGIIPRLGRDVLDAAEYGRSFSDDSAGQYTIEVSLLEIYNEKVFDLLSAPFQGTACRIREHPEDGAFVEHITKESISTCSDYDTIVQAGLNRRKIGETLMNLQSSRSHTVFSIYVTKTFVNKIDGVETVQTAKICLVDLAGSETVAKSGLNPMRIKEASFINKSLSTLCDVIQALSKRSAAGGASSPEGRFVPYRNSVLTWLLKDVLSGNCTTTILATVGPSEATVKESERTLRYIQRAKMISNVVHVNEKYAAKETEKMARLLGEVQLITEKFEQLISYQREKELQYMESINELKTSMRSEMSTSMSNISQQVEAVKGLVAPLKRAESLPGDEEVYQELSTSSSKHHRTRPAPLTPELIRMDWGDVCQLSPTAGSDRGEQLPSSASASKKPPRQHLHASCAIAGRGHKRSSSDNTHGKIQLSSSSSAEQDPPGSRRRSNSGDNVVLEDGSRDVVLTAISYLARRADSLRRFNGSTSHHYPRVKTVSGPCSGQNLPVGFVSSGIAMPPEPVNRFSTYELTSGEDTGPGFGYNLEDECDDFSDLHSLDSFVDKSYHSGPLLRSNSVVLGKDVDEIIAEYEYTIAELQAMIAGFCDSGSAATALQMLQTSSMDSDGEYFPYGGGKQIPDEPLEALSNGNVAQMEGDVTIMQLTQLLRERDAEIVDLKSRLEAFQKNDIYGEEDQTDHAVLSLGDDISSVASSNISSSTLRILSTKGSGQLLDRDLEQKIFTLEEFDSDYSAPQGSLALRLCLAAARERAGPHHLGNSPQHEVTPRLAMEDIHVAMDNIEHDRYLAEIKDLKHKLRSSLCATKEGKLPNPAWVEMETMMSYINRVLCSTIQSGRSMEFGDSRILMQHARTCDVVETFEVVRPMLASQFKSVVENCEEILNVWTGLNECLPKEGEDEGGLLHVSYKCLFFPFDECLVIANNALKLTVKELIDAKIRLAEYDVELTRIKGLKGTPI